MIGWCWHRYGRWSKLGAAPATLGRGVRDRVEDVQYRECDKCGKIQRRTLWQ